MKGEKKKGGGGKELGEAAGRPQAPQEGRARPLPPPPQGTPSQARPGARLGDSSETLPPQTPLCPPPDPRCPQPRAPRPAEQPRTKSISDASGKRKRESRLCHLETAAPSRSAASKATAKPPHFQERRVRSRPQRATQSFPDPCAGQFPPLAPSHAAAASAAVVPEVAAPAAAPPHTLLSLEL